MFKIFEAKLRDAKEYIMGKIDSAGYPPNHPFLHKDFENDFIMYILCILKIYLKETCMIDDFLCNKMPSRKNGVFDLEIYYQNINEITVLYYLIINYIINDDLPFSLIDIIYEPLGAGNKVLEYCLVLGNHSLNNIYVNIEVKTITCDPFIKEPEVKFRNGQKFIKPFFRDTELNRFTDSIKLDEYIVLNNSTHTRQISKRIKDISSKFTTFTDVINIGVIVIQYATSLEEFFTYLFHPQKGLLFNLEFNNIDCLTFFSLTATPDLSMQDMYEKNHVFSLLFDKRVHFIPYYQALGLDNFASINKEVLSPFKEFANREYGLFKWIVMNGLGLFVPEDASSDDINAYVEEIATKIYSKTD